MVCSIAASYLASKSATGFGKIVRGRVFSHVENFTAAGIRQDWYGIPDYPYNERYYAGTAGHDHDPSYDGDSTDDVYRGIVMAVSRDPD